MNLFRHLAGETEQELRLEVELMQLATSGRGSAGQQQSMEDERQSEGRKISQSWLNAAERVTRKTSVVRKSKKNLRKSFRFNNVFRQAWPAWSFLRGDGPSQKITALQGSQLRKATSEL